MMIIETELNFNWERHLLLFWGIYTIHQKPYTSQHACHSSDAKHTQSQFLTLSVGFLLLHIYWSVMGDDLSQNERVDEEKHQTGDPNESESIPALELQIICWSQPKSLNTHKHLSPERQNWRERHQGAHLSHKPQEQKPDASSHAEGQTWQDQRQQTQIPEKILRREIQRQSEHHPPQPLKDTYRHQWTERLLTSCLTLPGMCTLCWSWQTRRCEGNSRREDPSETSATKRAAAEAAAGNRAARDRRSSCALTSRTTCRNTERSCDVCLCGSRGTDTTRARNPNRNCKEKVWRVNEC